MTFGRYFTTLALMAALVWCCSCGSGNNGPVPAPGPPPPAPAPTPQADLKSVNHIIFMLQENRSFDHYFGMLNVRETLRAQVEMFGSTAPRAEKSKRIVGHRYQFTVSNGTATEIRDAEVERLAEKCSESLLARLFRKVTRYKLVDGATMLLAGSLPEGAPVNLRPLFARAVVMKETSPKLRIEKPSWAKSNAHS